MSDQTIVAHPKTGQPVREVKSYIDLDREQLVQEVKDNEAELEAVLADKRLAFEESLAHDEDVKAARSAVEDSKSELATYDSIASEPQHESPEEGAGGEDESDESAGDGSSEGSSGSPADSTNGARKVDVTVEDEVEVEVEEEIEDDEDVEDLVADDEDEIDEY